MTSFVNVCDVKHAEKGYASLTIVNDKTKMNMTSDFIWEFRKLPFPSHLGIYFNKIGKISAKIHEIGKIKAIFGLGMRPIYGLKNSEIKSLMTCVSSHRCLRKKEFRLKGFISLEEIYLSRQKQNYRFYLFDKS